MDTTRELKNSAFRRIFEANQRPIFSFFIGHGVDREDAVDLVQDTFTRAWLQIDKLESIDADQQRYWLFSVAKNLLADFGRRRVVQAKTENRLIQTASRNIQTCPDRCGETEALIQGIQSLPSEQRLILSLTVLGEMTSEMIGGHLKKPAGTIRYELHQARETLKMMMRDWRRGR